MTSFRTVLLACGLISVSAGHAMAQDSTATSSTISMTSGSATASSHWNCVVEPYLLVPYMTGTSGVHGLTSDVDANAGDILGALDFGAMLYFEAQSPRWAFSLDGTYMDLGAGGTTRLGDVDVDLKQSGVMVTGYARVKPWAEGTVGFQFNSIKGSLKGSGSLGVDLSTDQSWTDPYLGVRLAMPHSDKWQFGFFGAVGGFGVGSDFAWQAFPQVGYRFNPLFELSGGFRTLYMDYQNGSGNDEFTYKLTTYGPQVGGKFHF
jgi:hypothetical protein